MRPKHLAPILVLLALALSASPAHAGGVVSVCDEAHLLGALAGGGTVTFTCSGTITLSTEITIAADTTIDGSGQTVTISGNHAVRLFTVNAGVALNLNRLTIANGVAPKPADPFTASGGGIYNNGGTVDLSNSTVSGNSATDDGGGIYNGGTLTVSNSTFDSNTAKYGGGINTDRPVTLSNSTFSGNSAEWAGGGIYSSDALTVTNSTFSENIAGTFGPGLGGGIYCLGGTLIVSDSTFSDNNAAGQGGGISSGDVWNTRTLTLSNSTFSGNGAIIGGGIYNGRSSILTLSNGTFSGNGAIDGGGIYNDGGAVTLKNTIVANSPAGGNCANNDGEYVDGGGNLSYPDDTCPGINIDPMLGPLQNYGGPTKTMALLPGSAARDTADDAICAAPPINNLDQRGITRPQGPHCDIGAYESIQPTDYFYLPIIRR